MKGPVIVLSSGSSGQIAQAIVATATDKVCVIVADRPQLPDPDEMLRLVLKAAPRPEIELPPVTLKQSAYERRNPNRPFYDRFRKHRSHGR